MTLVPLDDIVGGDAAVQLATSGYARSIIFSEETGTGKVRVGDSTVSASRGSAIPASGQILTLPIPRDLNDKYSLSEIWVYVPTSSTCSVTLLV